MQMRLYRRADGRMVVVPALYHEPMALRREGALTRLGAVDIELLEVSDALVEGMGVHGYAVACPEDEAVLVSGLARVDASA
jgi:hypothetical protein